MGKPHKHAEVIKSAADGHTVQYKSEDGSWLDLNDLDAIEVIFCSPDAEFRIKPEREYPKTSFTLNELLPILVKHQGSNVALLEVADAAIKRYIDDQEGKE